MVTADSGEAYETITGPAATVHDGREDVRGTDA
jgi:hypothetical protein